MVSRESFINPFDQVKLNICFPSWYSVDGYGYRRGSTPHLVPRLGEDKECDSQLILTVEVVATTNQTCEVKCKCCCRVCVCCKFS
jgi:hypothetical protein